jgi:glycyl-tRNA synthetase
MNKPLTFQEMIMALERFWGERGCLIWQPHNVQVGAGTMNPATYLQVLGPEPWNVAYVEPSIRPADSRYGQNPNRLQRFYQYQVILKPEPLNPQELYLESLGALGIDFGRHDVRFVEDNWESPALGAWGLGWEVWLDGQEITQYTYFQQAGGFPTNPVAVELTYGLERIAMPLQGVRNFRAIEWAPGITYGDVHYQSEVEYSAYNVEHASVTELKDLFTIYERQVNRLLEQGLVLPAYDFVLNCSHTFNVLDARGAIGVTERANFFNRMRNLARNVARAWVKQREELGHPRLRPWVAGGVPTPRTPPETRIPNPKSAQPFVLEIGVEELPAGDLRSALEQLEANARRMLGEARLSYAGLRAVGTPRRLALLVDGLTPRQPDEEELLKGPPAIVAFDAAGKPTKAAEGFARSAGVPVDALTIKQEGKKEFVTALVRRAGLPAGDILAVLLPKLVASLTFGKTMRWETSGVAFSRPLRWFVSLLGNDIVPFEYAGLHAGRTTRGLRPHRSPAITISGAAGYLNTLQANRITVDVADRRAVIAAAAARLAGEVGGQIPDDAALLDEVSNLVEQPQPIRGRFDESFLKLPNEALIAVMKKHQRYFPVVDAAGKMLPYFVVIANGQTLDEMLVRAGNEEVLRARFADAAFFFQADSAHKLEAFLPRLETLTFQEKLGSMRDKARRLEGLAPILAERLGLAPAEVAAASRAAHLCKADLATQMVIEMTSLQGVMGREYARLSGETPETATAIFEQYLPRGAGDALPTSRAGVVLALADRLDTLMGLFAVGLVPTASADPFGLRRAALGLVQIAVGHSLRLSSRELLGEAGRQLPVACSDEAVNAAWDFIQGRLRGWLLEQGMRYDLADAALAECGDDPYRAYVIAGDLGRWVERPEWPALLAAYGRCVRIVRSQTQRYAIQPALYVEPASAALHQAYLTARAGVTPASSVDELFGALEPMLPAINGFFDDVLVMAEDVAVREARLGLLQGIAGLTAGICDLSKVEGF